MYSKPVSYTHLFLKVFTEVQWNLWITMERNENIYSGHTILKTTKDKLKIKGNIYGSG